VCYNSKTNSDKAAKQLESQLAEVNSKLDQSQRELQELNGAKSRAQSENADIGRKLEEAESQLNQLTKAKQALSKSLEEAKAALEEETRLRQKAGKARPETSRPTSTNSRDQLEEEQSGRADLQRLVQKANARLPTGGRSARAARGGVRSEELEELKKKFNAKFWTPRLSSRPHLPRPPVLRRTTTASRESSRISASKLSE
jgi:chromosome segregation ATPase